MRPAYLKAQGIDNRVAPSDPDLTDVPVTHVLVVDDDAFNRKGLNLYLSNHGYTVLETGVETEAIALAEQYQPQAAVIDIVIPANPSSRANINKSVGIGLVRKLKQLNPNMGIVVFSAHEDRGAEVWELIRDGQRGIAYLFKGIRPERLLQALRDTTNGQVILDGISPSGRPKLAEEILIRLTPEERPWVEKAVVLLPTLTEREWEVALRLAFSQNTSGIANALDIAYKTVENHVGRVYSKLGLNDVDERAPQLRKSFLLAKACMIYDLARSA